MTLLGFDMSHYDDPSIGTALAEGISFVTHKAGGDARDTELGAWWAGVRGLPDDVVLGAYWVLYPGRPVSRADEFYDRLNNVCPGWRDRDAWILQVDCEKWGGDAATMPPLADIQAFCDRLVERTGGAYRPIVYAPRWCYGNTLTGLTYPLWASHYVPGSGPAAALYPGDTSYRWDAYSGQTPVILQYSSRAVIGGQTTCDANAFRGSLEDLKELCSPGKDHVVKLDPDDYAKLTQLLAKTVQDTVAGVLGAKVTLQSDAKGAPTQQWRLDTAVGYAARKGYELLAAITGKDFVDEQAIVTGLAGSLPTAEQIAAAIPAHVAQDVVDILRARLES